MKTKTVAVFSINASGVDGALAKLAPGEPALVLAASDRRAEPKDVDDVAHFIEVAVRNLSSVIRDLRAACERRPDAVVFVLASPWYFSQTRTVHYEKTVPFLCTKSLVEEIVEKEVAYALEHNELGFEAAGTLVDRQISHIRLNGYPTNDPYGKHALSIDLSLTLSAAPKLFVDRMTDAVKRVYGKGDIRMTAAPYAAFIASRDYLGAQGETMLLSVGPIATDAAFVKDGLFLYQHSFPIGTLDLYRTLAEDDAHSLDEARAIIDTYRLSAASLRTQKGAVAAIERYVKRWSEALEGILDGGKCGLSLPGVCYLSTEPSFAKLFASAISADQLVRSLAPRGAIEVAILDADRFDKMIRGARVSPENALALLFATRSLYTASR